MLRWLPICKFIEQIHFFPNTNKWFRPLYPEANKSKFCAPFINDTNHYFSPFCHIHFIVFFFYQKGERAQPRQPSDKSSAFYPPITLSLVYFCPNSFLDPLFYNKSSKYCSILFFSWLLFSNTILIYYPRCVCTICNNTSIQNTFLFNLIWFFPLGAAAPNCPGTPHSRGF